VKQHAHEPLAETLQDPRAILLVSCYELGHQPLILASPLGFLERGGFTPEALDIGVERFDREKTARARLVGISVPMHTALRRQRSGLTKKWFDRAAVRICVPKPQSWQSDRPVQGSSRAPFSPSR
jgi:hypothetical protein